MRRVLLPLALLALTAGCTTTTPVDDEFGLSGDTDSGAVRVRAAPRDLSWHQLQVRVTGCGLEPKPVVIRMGTAAPYVNQPAASSGVALNPPDEMCRNAGAFQFSTEAGPVRVGDGFDLCSTTNGQAGAHDIMIAIETATTHKKLAGVGFSDALPVCA